MNCSSVTCQYRRFSRADSGDLWDGKDLAGPEAIKRDWMGAQKLSVFGLELRVRFSTVQWVGFTAAIFGDLMAFEIRQLSCWQFLMGWCFFLAVPRNDMLFSNVAPFCFLQALEHLTRMRQEWSGRGGSLATLRKSSGSCS